MYTQCAAVKDQFSLIIEPPQCGSKTVVPLSRFQYFCIETMYGKPPSFALWSFPTILTAVHRQSSSSAYTFAKMHYIFVNFVKTGLPTNCAAQDPYIYLLNMQYNVILLHK